MNTDKAYKSSYWLWDKGLPEELCDLAIKDMISMGFEDAQIGSLKTAQKNKVIRNSRVTFPDPNYWLEGIAFNYARYANISAEWNYKVSRPEQIQLAKYQKDHHYSWHEDWDPLELTSVDEIRKLSVVILLSDPAEFKGGEFQFKYSGTPEITIQMNKGSVLVFPSYITHRVTPIISGTRYSAANWIVGKNTL
jgi:PKHD-type hydroxylase